MNVYSVGEFCQHEGAGWDRLVADNDNTLKNIKKILIEHHEYQRNREMLFMSEEDEVYSKRLSQENIDGHNYIIDLVKNAKSIDDIKNVEIPPYNHDVIRISKQEILF